MMRRRILRALAALTPSIAVVGSLTATLAPDEARAEPRRWTAEGWRTDFSRHVVPLSEILDGGPPRDGIPSIDNPRFAPARDVGDVGPREPVIVFPLDGKPRAYPLRIMMWHEIVNDIVEGMPVAVTYCPLCNTAIVFDRRVGGRDLEFGATGKLRLSDLVMFDRETDSWWQQFTGEAIVGTFAGASLRLLPSRIIAFRDFRDSFPDGQVLIPNAPNQRRYGRNPYVDYDRRTRPYELFQGALPRGLAAMSRIVLARSHSEIVAVEMQLIVERQRIVLSDMEFAWQPGTASALDSADMAAARDVGSIVVRTLKGGPVVHDVTFAFAALAFLPNIRVLTRTGWIRLADGVPAP